jgi:hypothetical protein
MKIGNKENDAGLSFGVIGLLVCAGLLVALVALVSIFSGNTPEQTLQTQSQSNEIVTVRIFVESEELLNATTSINASSTVFDALRSATAERNLALEYKTYPGMGVLVTKIGDSKSGASGAYWQYWINGVYATVSADNALIHSNDVVEWKLTSSAQ